ncbi:TldD/PmbA family protein [Candidatus Woesearchaeota archaeon]|jgi:TldD protein|nr:TldD/PmbA family protein [Candidatus Woesearchaeota archaeon]MBT4114188.1 TldD/PmbA family protein [Candidatus Woesearchaeota archaeon]MBT4248256.1 TldD/PmbA family protein [Candidatus Woesearchaeota archaeon]
MDRSSAEFCIKLAQKLGASYSEARLENSYGDGYALKNGTPEPAGFSEETGIGIRVVVNGALGFASTNKIDKTSLKGLVTNAVRSAKRASIVNDQKIVLVPEKTCRDSVVKKQAVSFKSISAKQKLAYLQKIDKALLALGVNVPQRDYSIDTSVSKKYFINSEGSKIYSETPYLELISVLTVKEGARTNQSYLVLTETKGWEGLRSMKVNQLLSSKVKALQLNIRKGIPAPREKLDVVISPYVAGIIAHESCGHPYEADRIFGREAAQAGESFVTPAMIGTRIGTDVVSLVDDPNITGKAGSYKYDDEGVPARRKWLIKNGMIKELLHNRETAGQMGIKSNGSSRAANYSVEPIVRMSNTFFMPGKWKDEDLIKDTRKGVYIKSFMEWNIDDKRYNFKSVSNEAFMIRNGKLCEPVRNAAIELTTPQIYSAIDAVGKKVELWAASCGKGEPTQGIPVTMGGPHLRMRKIRLGRR